MHFKAQVYNREMLSIVALFAIYLILSRESGIVFNTCVLQYESANLFIYSLYLYLIIKYTMLKTGTQLLLYSFHYYFIYLYCLQFDIFVYV